MSRLHSVQASIADIARHFDVATTQAIESLTPPSEVTEGLDGLVVFEKEGRRVLRSLGWGFPRRTRETQESGDLPQRLGLVADLTNPMWDKIVVDPRYRCLIVLTHFANPDGEQGGKTRTWFSIEGPSHGSVQILAWAGFCRNTPEFGPVYAGMTMEANEAIPPTNDRMPVLLEPREYDRWLHGSISDVIWFQHRPPLAAERMRVERTEDLWRSGVGPPRQLALI